MEWVEEWSEGVSGGVEWSGVVVVVVDGVVMMMMMMDGCGWMVGGVEWVDGGGWMSGVSG